MGFCPDGREGAIVPFGEDDDGEGGRRTRADKAQWLPMVAGLRKKVRNSGVLTDWNVQVVQQGDEFEYQLGDEPFIHHKPALEGGRARKVIAAYSIATFPDGTLSREVMNADQLEDIRKKSRAKKGPWSDPVYYPEMCRKTVARLHAKQLPQSTDLDTLMRRDDELYDFGGAREEGKRAMPPPGSARAVLDRFADEPPPDRRLAAPQGEPPTRASEAAAPDGPEPGKTAPTPAPGPADAAADAADAGPPRNEAQYAAFAGEIIDEATNARDLGEWWNSAGQRRLRNACGVLRETFDALAARVRDRVTQLES